MTTVMSLTIPSMGLLPWWFVTWQRRIRECTLAGPRTRRGGPPRPPSSTSEVGGVSSVCFYYFYSNQRLRKLSPPPSVRFHAFEFCVLHYLSSSVFPVFSKMGYKSFRNMCITTAYVYLLWKSAKSKENKKLGTE